MKTTKKLTVNVGQEKLFQSILLKAALSNIFKQLKQKKTTQCEKDDSSGFDKSLYAITQVYHNFGICEVHRQIPNSIRCHTFYFYYL